MTTRRWKCREETPQQGGTEKNSSEINFLGGTWQLGLTQRKLDLICNFKKTRTQYVYVGANTAPLPRDTAQYVTSLKGDNLIFDNIPQRTLGKA